MTQEQFDEILVKILSNIFASDLLSIPGVYELVAEEYNNEVMSRYAEENEKETPCTIPL